MKECHTLRGILGLLEDSQEINRDKTRRVDCVTVLRMIKLVTAPGDSKDECREKNRKLVIMVRRKEEFLMKAVKEDGDGIRVKPWRALEEGV